MIYNIVRFLIMCAVLLSPIASAATDYYVDNAIGSDSNTGLSETAGASGPFANYYACVTQVNMNPGDTCFIKSGSGPYTVPASGLTLTRSGVSGNPITFRNYPGHTPVLACSGTVTSSSSCQSFVTSSLIQYISIIGLTIHNVNYAVHFSGGGDHFLIQSNHFYDTKSSSIQGKCAFCTVDRNWIHDNGDNAIVTAQNVQTTQQYGIYAVGQGWTISNNIIYRTTGFNIHIQGASDANPNLNGATAHVVNNTLGYSFNSSGIVVTTQGGGGLTGTIIENNIFFQPCYVPLSVASRCNTGAVGSFLGGGSVTRSAIQVSDMPSNANIIIRNNVSYDTEDTSGASFIFCVRSGIGYENEADCTALGWINPSNNSKTVNPTLTNAPTGSIPSPPDFTLTTSSTIAIDQGSTNSGTISYNGSAPDVGAFETMAFASCVVENATPTVGNISIQNNVNPPLQSVSTGFSMREDTGGGPASKTQSSSVISGTNQVDWTSTATFVSGSTIDTSYTTSTGTATDSANIGGTLNQPLFSFTNQSCTNNVSVGASYSFTQSRFAFYSFYGTESGGTRLPASGSADNVNKKIVPGGKIALRMKLNCQIADCPATAVILRYSKNSGAYTVMPDAFDAANIRFVGTGTISNVPSQGTATTERLTSDYASNVAGIVVRSSNAIPSFDFTQDSEGEVLYYIELDTDASEGDTYDFRLYKQDGSVLDTYSQTPRLTVTLLGAGVP